MVSAVADVRPAKSKGKLSGVKNFQASEDINITIAYREITVDATVGTDKDSDVYYNRIAERFTQLMGETKVQDRAAPAIKNRWLNTIQKSLLKFAACLNKAVAEYHSGWSLENYKQLAKKYFQSETGKPFIHELC